MRSSTSATRHSARSWSRRTSARTRWRSRSARGRSPGWWRSAGIRCPCSATTCGTRSELRPRSRRHGGLAAAFSRLRSAGVRFRGTEGLMETSAQGKAGIDAVHRYLDEQGIAHDVVDHEQTFSAAQEAKAAGVPPDHAAKTMVLRAGEEYRLAVIPASHRLDLHKARDALEAGFASFDVGAVPPLGPVLPAPEALDERLLEHDRILCSGGDHRHSVLLDPRDLARLG